MITEEEYDSLMEQLHDQFFEDPLDVVSQMYDVQKLEQSPYETLKMIAFQRLDQFIGHVKLLTRDDEEFDHYMFLEKKNEFYNRLLDEMTTLYNDYLNIGEPLQWTEELEKEEARAEISREEEEKRWSQWIGHTPPVERPEAERIASHLSNLAADLDQNGYLKYADSIDNTLKSLLK